MSRKSRAKPPSPFRCFNSSPTKERDRAAALKFMKKALIRQGSPDIITTDGLGSYKAVMSELGNSGKQEFGRWANNRVENSHLPFRRERAMLRFRQMKTLQKFATVHANVHNNHCNAERHLVDRQTFKIRRSAALADWQSIMS